MKRRRRFVGFALIFLVTLVFLPQLLFIVRFRPDTYSQLESTPAREYGIVFGAYVEEDQTLTDAALERVEAAVLLYHQSSGNLVIKIIFFQR